MGVFGTHTHTRAHTHTRTSHFGSRLFCPSQVGPSQYNMPPPPHEVWINHHVVTSQYGEEWINRHVVRLRESEVLIWMVRSQWTYWSVQFCDMDYDVADCLWCFFLADPRIPRRFPNGNIGIAFVVRPHPDDRDGSALRSALANINIHISQV